MNAFMSRRIFALAASSFGAAMMTSPLDFLTKMGGGGSGSIPSGSATPGSQSGSQAKPKVLVFDVNQTLLDLNALRPQFNTDGLFGWVADGLGRARRAWPKSLGLARDLRAPVRASRAAEVRTMYGSSLAPVAAEPRAGARARVPPLYAKGG